MDKRKRIIMTLAAIGGLGIFLLSGRKANAAGVASTVGFDESAPGGSSGANTFTSLLANALGGDAVDTSVQNIGSVDSFPGETNAISEQNIKLAPPVTVEQSPPRTTSPIAVNTSGSGGGGTTGYRVAYH